MREVFYKYTYYGRVNERTEEGVTHDPIHTFALLLQASKGSLSQQEREALRNGRAALSDPTYAIGVGWTEDEAEQNHQQALEDHNTRFGR